jgi:hypothetical protein
MPLLTDDQETTIAKSHLQVASNNSQLGSQKRNDTAATTLRGDMLDYIADMLHELKILADSTGCATLIGLIELAAREAEINRSQLR